MNSYILSIDAGTTGITILLLSKNGKVINKYYEEFKQYYPKPGWVEHDGEEIWSKTKKLMTLALNEHQLENCKAIGITNQRETTLIWDKKTGKLIHNAIVWQCRRTNDICKSLINNGYDKIIKNKTGLILDSYFSATKIKWLLDNLKDLRKKSLKGQLAFGTIDTWLLWKLTSGSIHATDYTNASRTMLFNITNKQWDDDLLKIFDIPKNILPDVYPSANLFGYTNTSDFNGKIPITGLIGDQQAALFGQKCFNKNDLKCTYGTGSFLLINTGDQYINSNSGLLTTLACNKEGLPSYALEGSIFMGGAIIQWLRDELKIINNANETNDIALSVNDTNGVIIVPAFVGLGAPYWNSNARGIIYGLTRGANRNHIVRAALESIAFQVNDLIKVIEKEINSKITTLSVDGGATQNKFLMQFQANISKINILKSLNIETTAIGAAMLAGIKVQFFDQESNLKTNKNSVFSNKIKNKDRQDLLNNWDSAINIINI